MANTHSLDLEASSSQYASITDASQTGLDITGDLTIEAWIKPESLGGTHIIASKYDASNRSYYLYVTNGSIGLWTSTDGTNGSVASIAQAPTLDVWQHIAVTYVASTRVTTFYANGVSIGTDLGSYTSLYNGTANFAIGAYNTASTAANEFDGLIDEVRIWNDIRTITEIQENIGIQLVGTEANLQGYWKLDNNYLDETSNDNDLTASGSPVFSTSVPFQNPDGVSGSYLETNCQGYWTLDEESGTRADSTANGNDLTDNNTVGFGAGKIGNAADFEASNSEYLSITDASQTGLDITGDMTVSSWVNMESTGNRVIVARYDGTSTTSSFVFYIRATNLIMLIAGASTHAVSAAHGLSTGTFAHVAVTYKSGTGAIEFFVNGISIGGGTSIYTTIKDSTADFKIGFADSPFTYFDGLIDETAIWDKTLDFGSIQDLYNAGDAITWSSGLEFIIAESLSLSETTTNLRGLVSTTNESLSLSETISALKGLSFTIAESLGLVESYTYLHNKLFTIAESLELVEIKATVQKKWSNISKSTVAVVSNTAKTAVSVITNKPKS